MILDVDILATDAKIKNVFRNEIKNIPNQKIKLKELKKSLEFNCLSIRIKKSLKDSISLLSEYIEKVEMKTDLYFYVSDSAEYIEKYKKIISTPIKISFVGKPMKDSQEKINVISNYLKIAKKYVDIIVENTEKKKKLYVIIVLIKRNLI
jgi:hypothetical protein